MTAEQSVLAAPEFQMALLLFVALAGYLPAYRINQSAVVGIILAGVAVGPSLLGLVTYTDFVSSLAQLGAIILLFTIGLEFRFPITPWIGWRTFDDGGNRLSIRPGTRRAQASR